jgi:hypothetical protein
MIRYTLHVDIQAMAVRVKYLWNSQLNLGCRKYLFHIRHNIWYVINQNLAKLQCFCLMNTIAYAHSQLKEPSLYRHSYYENSVIKKQTLLLVHYFSAMMNFSVRRNG